MEYSLGNYAVASNPEVNMALTIFIWIVFQIIVIIIVWLFAYHKAKNYFYTHECRTCRYPLTFNKLIDQNMEWENVKLNLVITIVKLFPDKPIDYIENIKQMEKEIFDCRNTKNSDRYCCCTFNGLNDNGSFNLIPVKKCEQHGHLVKE